MKKLILLLIFGCSAIFAMNEKIPFTELVQIPDAVTLRTRLTAAGFEDFAVKTLFIFHFAEKRIKKEYLYSEVAGALYQYVETKVNKICDKSAKRKVLSSKMARLDGRSFAADPLFDMSCDDSYVDFDLNPEKIIKAILPEVTVDTSSSCFTISFARR